MAEHNSMEAAKVSNNTSPLNVAILGAPVTVGNRGVQALGTSLVELCYRRARGGKVFLMLGHHRPERLTFRLSEGTLDVEVVNCRLSPKARPTEHLAWILLAAMIYRLSPFKWLRKPLSRITPWISTLERADLVGDIRGGDSFSDIYGMGRFLHGFALALSVILVKGEIVQFPQTFGPFRNPVSKALAGFLFRRSPVIMARDRESLELAKRMARPGAEVILCPDVAFSLQPIEPEKIDVEPGLPQGQPLPRFIGLNVNGLMYNGGYSRDNMFGLKLDYRGMLPKLVETLLEEWEGEVWFVPHTYGPWKGVENDLDASRAVINELRPKAKSRVRLVVGSYDCMELKWIIGKSEFFIGSRMHSCIAALSQGVPCVGIAYSRKFKGVFDTLGVGEWVIDGRAVDKEETLRTVVELYRIRDGIRDLLRVQAHIARGTLKESFETLLEGSEGLGSNGPKFGRR
ncbi:MAG: polysaccharide pyruvyl transferase family protein [Candidatus Hadarchaeum sp.]